MTTMTYTHVLGPGAGAVRRPMDRLTEPTGGPGEIGGSAYHGRDDGGSEPRWGVGLG